MAADHTETDSERTGSLLNPAAGAPLPSRIGHYTVKRLIGSGGMGAVYEALQEQPRRVVALKVLRVGVAGRSALRRFEYESQLLARLRHPGIAQVYEAGTHETPSGPVPFFAMEYIPGARTVTGFAAATKLGTRGRMELLARVCDAVHHGHQKGIIHRDLKPGNILVDSSGEPKIIDFGVARATDSDMAVTTLQTDVGQLIGTLAYMSPEQCAADPHDIDVRSDVYSLGVVLYELLCGRMPYDVSRSALAEATRKIREEEPTKLSTLDRTLRGDPETIALKALEKERERRYRSAADLADDLRRYLKGEPISARPASVTYQVRVFARRHKAVAGAVVAVLAVTSAAAVVSTMFWYSAVRNRDRALTALGVADEARRAETAALTKEADARRTAQAEAADARFQSSAARARAIDAQHLLQSLAPLVRMGYDAMAMAPGPFRDDCPQGVVPDTEAWMSRRFPDLFDDPARTGSMRTYIDEFDSYEGDAATREAVFAWIRGNDGRLAEVGDATGEVTFRYHSAYSAPDQPLVTGLFAALGQLRTMSGALVLRALAQNEAGWPGAAFQSLRAARRLARDAAGGGSLISASIEWRLRTRINGAFRHIAVAGAAVGGWPEQAGRFIESDAPIPPADLWTEMERPVVRQIIDSLFVKTGEDRPRFDRARALPLLSALGPTPDEAALARYEGSDYETTVGAYEGVLDLNRTLVSATIEELERFDPAGFYEMVRQNPILELFSPRLWRSYMIRARACMDRDATIITAALAAHRAARGAWPSTIDDALAGFPVRPLRRDYYGRDFVYRVEGDRPVLYSVGPDGSDDGGTRAWDDQARDGGDLIYIAPGPT